MNTRRDVLIGLACLGAAGTWRAMAAERPAKGGTAKGNMSTTAARTDAEWKALPDSEWKALLSPMQYKVLRKAATEPAFTGEYWNNHASGIYVCAGCGQQLFRSDTKFESGTGWPSFWAPIDDKAVVEHVDTSWFMRRVEIVCSRCGGHLGHVFSDGPKPTGLRYCMNSAALRFVSGEK